MTIERCVANYRSYRLRSQFSQKNWNTKSMHMNSFGSINKPEPIVCSAFPTQTFSLGSDLPDNHGDVASATASARAGLGQRGPATMLLMILPP